MPFFVCKMVKISDSKIIIPVSKKENLIGTIEEILV